MGESFSPQIRSLAIREIEAYSRTEVFMGVNRSLLAIRPAGRIRRVPMALASGRSPTARRALLMGNVSAGIVMSMEASPIHVGMEMLIRRVILL